MKIRAASDGRFTTQADSAFVIPVFRNRCYLVVEYIEKRKSSGQIASENGVNHKTILYWLHKLKVPRRSVAVARITKYGNKPTNEDKKEHAHLLRLAFPEKHRAATKRHYDKYHRKEPIPPEVRQRKNRERRTAYSRNRRRNDPGFRIRTLLSNRLHALLKGRRKEKSMMELLGCSLRNLQIYLESKFESGMTWGNHGFKGWHVDHIMPCAIFDLTKIEHQRRCFHFSNLQPLWARDNQSKGAKLATNQYPLL